MDCLVRQIVKVTNVMASDNLKSGRFHINGEYLNFYLQGPYFYGRRSYRGKSYTVYIGKVVNKVNVEVAWCNWVRKSGYKKDGDK